MGSPESRALLFQIASCVTVVAATALHPAAGWASACYHLEPPPHVYYAGVSIVFAWFNWPFTALCCVAIAGASAYTPPSRERAVCTGDPPAIVDLLAFV